MELIYIPRRRQAYSISLATRINALQWRRNERDNVSNHQPRDCLLNRLSGADQRKIKVPPVTGLRAGNLPVTGEFLAPGPVTPKKLPFDDVIMQRRNVNRKG